MEPIKEHQNGREIAGSSLGLGAALAVAYDITEDPNLSQSGYSHAESSNASLVSSSRLQPGVPSTARVPYNHFSSQCQPVRYHAGDPYWAVNDLSIYQQHTLQQQSSSSLPMAAYLTPISVTSPSSFSKSTDSGSFYQQPAPQPSISFSGLATQPPTHDQVNGCYSDPTANLSGTTVGPGSESTLSTDSMLSVRSDTLPVYSQTSEMGYTIKPSTPISTTNGTNGSAAVAASSVGGRKHEDQRQAAVPSSGSDDGLYELSEEDVKKIDDMLMQNPEVTSSRHWKYYMETNEWTRATCALMACLFTRDQMANSTVLGRGGSQRERLPTNLVAYVVTKMRRRFNKPAAAVRARMAQKCKDERRFGRVVPSGGVAPNSDRSPAALAGSSALSNGPSAAASSSSMYRNSGAVGGGGGGGGNRRRSASGYGGSSAKSARLSVNSQSMMYSTTPHQTPAVDAPSQPTGLLASLVPSSSNSSNPAAVVNDPPVILASAPEMAS